MKTKMRYLIFHIIFSTIFINLSLRTFPEDMHMHHDKSEIRHLSGVLKNDIRTIQVKTFRYGFDPDPIVVKYGEKVRLEVTSTDITHGLAIKNFGINVVTKSGKTNAAEFIADKKGTFHIHCSVYCGPGHGKMHGALVIID